MNIPTIKRLAESISLDDLREAETALLDERPPEVSIEGEDEGERLTHVYAAIFVLEKMKTENLGLNQAIRAYTDKVRNSVG